MTVLVRKKTGKNMKNGRKKIFQGQHEKLYQIFFSPISFLDQHGTPQKLLCHLGFYFLGRPTPPPVLNPCYFSLSPLLPIELQASGS